MNYSIVTAFLTMNAFDKVLVQYGARKMKLWVAIVAVVCVGYCTVLCATGLTHGHCVYT